MDQQIDPTDIPNWDLFTTRARVRILLAPPYSWKVRDIAGYLNLSTQAVYRHVGALRERVG